MVRFIHISDVHLGFEQYGEFRRFRDFGRAFKNAMDLGISEKVDFILIAGDLFNKKNINATTLLQADEVLSSVHEAGIPVIVCEGNHDSLSYGNNWSWLGYLSMKGLIILLGPGDHRNAKAANRVLSGTGIKVGDDPGEEDGDNPVGEGSEKGRLEDGILAPWDPESREGSYIELVCGDDPGNETVRIYGFGYLGAATKTLLSSYASAIIRDDAMNIGMLHAGVEGIILNMHGTIAEHALSPLKGKIDYLALGHIHKKFSIDNWVFNPGSLENWSLDETDFFHGLYQVDMHRDNEGKVCVNAEFKDGVKWRRPFIVWKIDMSGSKTASEVLDRVKLFVRKRMGLESVQPDQGNGKNGIQKTIPSTKSDQVEEHKHEHEIYDRKRMKPKPERPLAGTLDAYFSLDTNHEKFTMDADVQTHGVGGVSDEDSSNGELIDEDGSNGELIDEDGSNGELIDEDGLTGKSTDEVDLRGKSIDGDRLTGESTDGVCLTGRSTDEVGLRGKSIDGGGLTGESTEEVGLTSRSTDEGDPSGELTDESDEVTTGVEAELKAIWEENARPGLFSEAPVIIVRLQGDLDLGDRIDLEPIKDHLSEILEPKPVYLEVRDETAQPGVHVEIHDIKSKEDLERQVIMELLQQGAFSSYSNEIHTVIREIRDAVVKREGLADFSSRLSKIASDMESGDDDASFSGTQH